MKHGILLVLLLPLAALAVAQQPLSSDLQKKWKNPRWLYVSPSVKGLVLPSQDTSKVEQYRKLLEAQRLHSGGLVTATYSHNTSRGKVYTLTPDNMPCLAPDKKAVAAMPNASRLFVPDNRQQAQPRQPIIPQGEEKDKK
ncbi:hypothetical protein HB364_29490 [Pseudoflavitalea sp. X16]|uniref:hypothetical protein n=1 Tax=Paraflavitalea devenefica TaxID=2716334 RepID=UPI001423F8B9|nr:hypothetical protein [Paraflavitalea devenefica]NII29249.1 hypothetical protein [Paraflavitalea devenefica]